MNIFSFFKKFQYETIAVRHFTITWTDQNDKEEKITYVFKANGFDKRKVDIHAYGLVKKHGYDKNNSLYHDVVLPWLEKDPALNKPPEPEKPKEKKKADLICIDGGLKKDKK